MEWISLELKQISCKHLKAFNFFQKPSVYAAVSIFDDEVKENKQKEQEYAQRQKTPVDTEGGGNPEWNHPMQFDLKSVSFPDHGKHLFLRFKLRCDGVVYGKRSIGEVRVPFQDLIDEFNGSVRFVSYQVKTRDGRANGVLSFSYKINGKAKKGVDEINGKAKKGVDDSKPESQSPSRAYFSPEKVRYPSLDPPAQATEKCLYPSLEEFYTVPVPALFLPTQEFYTLQMPVYAGGNGVCYNSPLVQAPGPYWYSTETRIYDYGLQNYPGSCEIREA